MLASESSGSDAESRNILGPGRAGQLGSESDGQVESGSDIGDPGPAAKVARVGALESESDVEVTDIVVAPPVLHGAHALQQLQVVDSRQPLPVVEAIAGHRFGSDWHQEPGNDHIWSKCFGIWKASSSIGDSSTRAEGKATDDGEISLGMVSSEFWTRWPRNTGSWSADV